jgi:hypothetical protein
MALKLSIFTTITRPLERGDAFKQALDCYADLADEVVVMDGGGYYHNETDFKVIPYEWPREFSWPFIGEQFQRGYEACSGDWVIHCDLDMIFHQKDFGKIRQAIKDFDNSPALSFYKWQFILPDRYNLKSRLVLAVNKGKFGDNIRFDSGGDLCQPSFNGELLLLSDMPQAGVPFYNYEKILKTKEQIMDDQGRMERAYKQHFGHYQLAKNETDASAFQGWLQMQYGRLNKPHAQIKLEEHPKYMQETIKNLTPEQFGYNAFGYVERNNYA